MYGPGGVASEPAYTTWKFRSSGEQKHTIDYIWHSPEVAVVGVDAIPSVADIGGDGLPTLTFPSDHLSLSCTLQCLRE